MKSTVTAFRASYSLMRGRFGLVRRAKTFAFIISSLTLIVPILVIAPVSATPNINEYPVTDGPNPDTRTITQGPDGNMWFADNGNDAIGKITPAGVITEYHLNIPASSPNSITQGPDGAMWFTENNSNNQSDEIGRITTTGSITLFPTEIGATALGITTGSDGALWFTEDAQNAGAIGRMTTTGAYSKYLLPSPNSAPNGITTGPDGNMWFDEIVGSSIGEITPSGTITEFPTPTPNAYPYFITSGPENSLWFGEFANNAIGQITTSGVITEYPISTPNSAPYSIATGSDGSLWYTEGETNGTYNAIGRMTTAGVSTQYPLPSTYSASEISAGSDGNMWFTSDTGGNQSNIDKLTIPPTGLTELTAASPTQSAPILNWGTVAGTASYNIYRDGSLLGSSNTNSNTDNTATPGTHTYYVTSIDGNGDESVQSNTVTVVYNMSPGITSAASYATSVHTPFDFKVTTSGNPTSALSESGALPPGVTFNDNGDGTADISGTVPVGSNGSYPLTITADNGLSPAANQAFSLNITTNSSAPSITSVSSDTEAYGQPMNFTVNTGGFPLPTLKKSGALPSGVTFVDNGDGTATISGTPNGSSNGVYPITITAKNSTGTASQSFNLTITKAPIFKNIPNKQLTGTVGTPYSMTVSASGYAPPRIRLQTSLPNGLNFNDNGDGTATISGTPATGSGGTYTINLFASNSYGNDSATFTLKINEAPVITSSNTATATIGSAFSFQVTSTGYPSATYSLAGMLPKGIRFNKNSGAFSGKPKVNTAGTYMLTITGSNSLGSNSQNLDLTVQH
jgi:streptogramin lyase